MWATSGVILMLIMSLTDGGSTRGLRTSATQSAAQAAVNQTGVATVCTHQGNIGTVLAAVSSWLVELSN